MAKQKFLTMEHSVRTLSIKCYGEQLGLDGTATSEQLRAKLSEIIPFIDRETYQVIAIVHDRDAVSDDEFLPAG